MQSKVVSPCNKKKEGSQPFLIRVSMSWEKVGLFSTVICDSSLRPNILLGIDGKRKIKLKRFNILKMQNPLLSV